MDSNDLQRMFQSSGIVHADETPVQDMTVKDIDLFYFSEFYEKHFGEGFDSSDINLAKIFSNMNVLKQDRLTIAGALLFGKKIEFKLPAYGIKCVSYPGNDTHVAEYRDSEDICGKLEEIFRKAIAFLTRNLKHIQNGQNVNSLGVLEVPVIVFEEIVANALIHRDYFVSAPIRIFIFDDRIEIISPGHLPNNLTIENIISGNSNIRNPILASYATKILPYRGLGNGIRRALKEYKDISFIDDRDGNLFQVVVKRIC